MNCLTRFLTAKELQSSEWWISSSKEVSSVCFNVKIMKIKAVKLKMIEVDQGSSKKYILGWSSLHSKEKFYTGILRQRAIFQNNLSLSKSWRLGINDVISAWKILTKNFFFTNKTCILLLYMCQAIQFYLYG